MFKTQDGRIIDDYREAYWWLRDRTPKSARVLSWWDYGIILLSLSFFASLCLFSFDDF